MRTLAAVLAGARLSSQRRDCSPSAPGQAAQVTRREQTLPRRRRQSPRAHRAARRPVGTLDWYQGTGSPRVPVPPSTFDPLSATASELEGYGFPPRPSDASALADWTSEMQSWKPTPDHGLCQMPAPLGSGAQVSTDASSSWAHVGSSWSGYVAKQTSTT